MSSDIKDRLSSEINSRIVRLKQHYYDEIDLTGNQYEELNQALSKVIAVPLIKELESLKEYVRKL